MQAPLSLYLECAKAYLAHSQPENFKGLLQVTFEKDFVEHFNTAGKYDGEACTGISSGLSIHLMRPLPAHPH